MSRRCDALEPLHSAWVDGELRGRERSRLAAHLQRCGRCRAAISELRVTSTMLRSLPTRNLVVDVTTPTSGPRPRSVSHGSWRRALARSTAAMALVVAGLGVAAFAAGSPVPEGERASVPVDVYVADHLVRAVGGPVSTPALLEPSR